MPIFKNITGIYSFGDLRHAEVYATRLSIRFEVAAEVKLNKKMNAGYN